MNETGKLIEAKAFLDNPKSFVAGAASDAMLRAVFGHCRDRLNGSMAEFERRYPSIEQLQSKVLGGSRDLKDFAREYQSALAQLRLPDARKTFLYAAVALQINENTPDHVVRKLLQQADAVLANLPSKKAYVERFYDAKDLYVLATDAVREDVKEHLQGYLKEAGALGAELQRRAAALNQAKGSLDEICETLANSGLIAWTPVEIAYLQLNSLAENFGALAAMFQRFGHRVAARDSSTSRRFSGSIGCISR
ncbi:MAG: hypothetical protein HC872_03520 [Gammaproteobacteria bacterium]|nr:hypothetical protein [Gammaproteobacteria bacterium]